MPNGAIRSPGDVEGTFRLLQGLYLVGSMERGVTIYSQQVRAHNLAWAIRELHLTRGEARVAIVGGGIAGLTMTAGMLCLNDRVQITLFEKSWDLCPFQQGADTRWVHPKIYDWPFPGSRAPSASLPVLNWSEGRASDVARTVLREFGRYAHTFANAEARLSVYLDLRHFQVNAADSEISWIGHKAVRQDEFFHLGRPEGRNEKFDIIVLATGFGAETIVPGYQNESYWRNEQLGQPALDGGQHRYLISGFGDGALVDLCRLTIERFRQDTIVYELFEEDLESIESYFGEALDDLGPDANVFDLLHANDSTRLLMPRERLANRIRKDTRVTLHLLGHDQDVTRFPSIFGRHSSFLHRLITYLLYRCGAFDLDFSELAAAVGRHNIDPSNVLCRYGADTLGHLKSLFVDPDTVTMRLMEMKQRQLQKPNRFWIPGTFPHYSNRQA
jgi:hypothetical protein